MSKWIAAEIWVGGTVRAALVPRLCQAITSQEAALTWGDRRAMFVGRPGGCLLPNLDLRQGDSTGPR